MRYLPARKASADEMANRSGFPERKTMAAPIPVFGLKLHIRENPSQRILLHDSLKPYAEFEQIAWDGETLPPLTSRQAGSNTRIFYMLPPPFGLMRDSSLRIVWIPMWDEARGYDADWWQRIPKRVRVVAFSREVSLRARAAGLETLDLKFHFPPERFPQADLSGARVLLFWNRTGLVGKNFLARLCRELDVDLLIHFRNAAGSIPAPLACALGDRLGRTRVRNIESERFLPPAEHRKILDQANIFLAPRASEGVGLSLLEALARGCAAFAFDAPTMNEYIVHKDNGYLFRRFGRDPWNRIRGSIAWRLDALRARITHSPKPVRHTISDWQDWNEAKALDLMRMGKRARQTQAGGFQAWKDSIPKFASFLLDW
jgi:hypothetical protein